jgi:hypothetical protein
VDDRDAGERGKNGVDAKQNQGGEWTINPAKFEDAAYNIGVQRRLIGGRTSQPPVDITETVALSYRSTDPSHFVAKIVGLTGTEPVCMEYEDH